MKRMKKISNLQYTTTRSKIFAFRDYDGVHLWCPDHHIELSERFTVISLDRFLKINYLVLFQTINLRWAEKMKKISKLACITARSKIWTLGDYD